MILITGGLGFIGLHTVKRFVDAGEKVVLTHYRVRREPDFIKAEIGKSIFIEPLDVTSAHDAIALTRKYKVTGIVHLAVPALNALSAAEEAASRLLWKIEKAYSLGIPKKKLALGESQTEEEHAYGRKYTMFWRNGRSFRT